MMRIKKIIAVMLMSVLSLSGCGSDEQAGSESDVESTAAQEEVHVVKNFYCFLVKQQWKKIVALQIYLI